jgi:hypothetical protein
VDHGLSDAGTPNGSREINGAPSLANTPADRTGEWRSDPSRYIGISVSQQAAV